MRSPPTTPSHTPSTCVTPKHAAHEMGPVKPWRPLATYRQQRVAATNRKECTPSAPLTHRAVAWQVVEREGTERGRGIRRILPANVLLPAGYQVPTPWHSPRWIKLSHHDQVRACHRVVESLSD